MKRSMMLRKIDYLMSTSHPDSPSAEEVLECVEAWGMVPPINEAISWNLGPNGKMTYAEHVWEEEDAART